MKDTDPEITKKDEELVAYLTAESDSKPEGISSDSDSIAMKEAWEQAGTAYVFQNTNPDLAWDKLKADLQPSTKRIQFIPYRLLKYAAIFLLLLAFGGVTYLLTTNDAGVQQTSQLAALAPELKTVKTVDRPSDITVVTLPDGTVVRMNANSKLSYPEQFSSGNRLISLEGEAFFEVAHDSLHPFIVKMKEAEVEVLGTSFNISAYPEKGKVEVNVATGKVKLSNSEHTQKVLLPAGTSGKYWVKRDELNRTTEVSENFNAWFTKEISFHHSNLANVFEELENIYHIKIEYADPQIATIPYTANFAHAEINEIVDIIAKTHRLSVTKSDARIVFNTKPKS